MNLKQTLLTTTMENTVGSTVFVPFPAFEKSEGDKVKKEKLLLNSQGLIRIFLISACILLLHFPCLSITTLSAPAWL